MATTLAARYPNIVRCPTMQWMSAISGVRLF